MNTRRTGLELEARSRGSFPRENVRIIGNTRTLFASQYENRRKGNSYVKEPSIRRTVRRMNKLVREYEDKGKIILLYSLDLHTGIGEMVWRAA